MPPAERAGLGAALRGVAANELRGDRHDVAHGALELDAALHVCLGQAADMARCQVGQRAELAQRETHCRVRGAEAGAARQLDRQRRLQTGELALDE
jgi:hypothetical protein